jgi:spore coat protein U-like protein
MVLKWIFGVALFCGAMQLCGGNASAQVCTINSVSSLVLASSFDPVALTAGTQISSTVQGTCSSLNNPGDVRLTINNGSNFQSGSAFRAMLCGACAGPNPFNLLQYQIYESDGATVFPTSPSFVSVSCANPTNCKSATGSTFTYTFFGQIVTPVTSTSVNDSQIGSYSDGGLSISATGKGATAVNAAIPTTASVGQFCTISTTTSVGFGAYDPLTVSAVTNATGKVTVTCTRGNSGVTLTLSGGSNAAHATSPQTRAMVGAAHGDYISYDIFETSAYATRYPTTAVAQTVSGGITTPSVVSLFGQIAAAAQNVSVDSYGDSVSATVNF